jgi:hypothetical protein
MRASGSISAGYVSEYNAAERRAAWQGRRVTDAERDAAGRAGDRARGSGAAAIAAIEAEDNRISAQIEAMGRRYRKGCMAEALPKSARTLLAARKTTTATQ